MNERDLVPRRAAHTLAPFAMVLVLIFAVVMLCSSSTTARTNNGQGSLRWTVADSQRALKGATDANARRVALVALHRNIRAAIASLADASLDPTAHAEAMRLLSDIERELGEVGIR